MVGHMDHVRTAYGVPAKRGARVAYQSNGGRVLGTIRGARNGKLRIQLDGDKFSLTFHPTWRLEYLPQQ